MYVTYESESKRIVRADSVKIVPDKGNTMTDDIDVSDEILDTLCYYRYIDGDFVKDPELEEEAKLNLLRMKREPLLAAFDIYKSNLIIGAIDVTETEKSEVLEWYHAILDLDETAIQNPPDTVKRYVKE